MDTFSLLHISDLHIAANPRVLGFPDWLYFQRFPQGVPSLLSPSSFDPFLAEAVARIAFLRSNSIDAILVSGDIATTSEAADLTPAFQFIDAAATPGIWLSPSNAPTLQGASVPVVLLPGNHDRFQHIFHTPGGNRFDRIFANYWAAPQKVLTLLVLQGANGEKLALIAADFTLARNNDASVLLGFLGQGKVYQAILAALEVETQSQRATHGSLAIVWIIHFPPEFPGLPDVLSLIDGPLLGPAAGRASVFHFFCGHAHQAREYALPSNNAVTVHCAGTATQYYTHHGNVLHTTEIDVDAGNVTAVRRTDLVWDQARQNFV
jgi:hypothetical protein